MEEQNLTYTDIDRRERNSRKFLVFVVISILLGVNGLLLWQFFDKKSHLEEVSKTLESATAERDALSAELQRVKADYDKVNQENSGLQAQLSAKDEEIKAKIAEIKRLIDSGDAAQLKTAREELERLKAMNQTYLAQADSLRTNNLALTDQNAKLNTNLTEQQSKLNSLTEENSMLAGKVAAASMLKAVNVTSVGVKYKSNGKEIITNKAAAAQKIKTCFTVLENTVANTGPKEIYMRAVSNDGAVLTTSSETFMIKGQASLFTMKETIDYNNREANICMYWEKGSAYASGNYTVEIYCDGALIGTAQLVLK